MSAYNVEARAKSMFSELEGDLEVTIPNHLKCLLVFAGYGNLYSLANFDSSDVSTLEEVASKHLLDCEMADIYPPDFNGQNYTISLPHRKLLVAVGKHADYKVKNLTS